MQSYMLGGIMETVVCIPPIAAADATVVFPLLYGNTVREVSYVKIYPSAAVTGDNTNTKYLNIRTLDAAASADEQGHYDLVTNSNLAAGIAVSIPLTSGAIVIDGAMDLQVEKVGSGVALPPMLVVIGWKNGGLVESTVGSVGAAS